MSRIVETPIGTGLLYQERDLIASVYYQLVIFQYLPESGTIGRGEILLLDDDTPLLNQWGLRLRLEDGRETLISGTYQKQRGTYEVTTGPILGRRADV